MLKFILLKASNSIKEIKFSQLKGETVAIDASIAICQLYYAGIANNIKVNGKYINHIQGVLFKATTLLKNGINQIWVFDNGKAPIEKANTIAARKAARGNKKYPNKEVFEECIQILKFLGISICFAEGEAEATCAAISNYVISTDSDCLLYTNVKLIKGWTRPVLIDSNAVLNELKLNRLQFIEMCVAAGTDYNKGIYSIATAYKKILIGPLPNITCSLFKMPDNITIINNDKDIDKLRVFLYKNELKTIKFENMINYLCAKN